MHGYLPLLPKNIQDKIKGNQTYNRCDTRSQLGMGTNRCYKHRHKALSRNATITNSIRAEKSKVIYTYLPVRSRCTG